MVSVESVPSYQNDNIFPEREGKKKGKLISGKDLQSLSKLNPIRAIGQIIFEWSVIALSIYISEQYLYLYPLAVLVIAGRIHALAILMHEAAHYRIIKNKKISDIIGDVFLAWPILFTVSAYRRNHFEHHRFTNTDNDPDWVVKSDAKSFEFPQNKKEIWKRILGYFLCINVLSEIRMASKRLKKLDQHSGVYKNLRKAFYFSVVVGCLISGLGVELLMYWIFPLFSAFFSFMYVRSVAEHFGSMEYGSNMLKESRTVYPYFWEKWFFSPNNVCYHLDHHLYPSVPFYNLKKLHNILLENEDFKRDAHITRGYVTGVINECSSSDLQLEEEKLAA